MATKQLTVTAEEIQAWKTGKQDTIVSGTNATGTGNVVLANSPALVTPTVNTASVGTNTTQVASTAYVKAEIVATTPTTVDISIATVSSATKGDNSTLLANTNFVRENDNLLNDLIVMGFAGTLLPAGTNISYTNGPETMSSGIMRISTFIVKTTTAYTGVKFYLGTAGVYTANNVNGFCLYSYAGGTSTKIANSETILGSMWTTANLNTVPFANIQILSPGEYKLVYIYSSSVQTTAPTIVNFCSTSYGAAFASAFSNANQLQTRLDSQTTFPANFNNAGLSGMGAINSMWLY
jgi:hypothetical protein